MNEKPTYELDKILSSVEPEHFNRCLSVNSLTGI